MLVKDIILELYDSGSKFTGNKPPPPSRRGGPDWEGDENPLWREFFEMMREKLVELEFKIIYPSTESETDLQLNASWPLSVRQDNITGKITVMFTTNSEDYDTAILKISEWKPGSDLNSKPTNDRILRIRVTDFYWVLRKIITIQNVIKQNKFKSER